MLDLVHGEAGARRWLSEVAAVLARESDLAAAAAWSGPALAAAMHVAAGRAPSLAAPAFVVSVGDAVRRGVPTAARATLSARAPMRTGLTEAQVGGPFGRSLSIHADALVLLGGAQERRVVRVVEGGVVRSEVATAALLGEGTAGRARALAGAAQGHVLTVGPAAEAGLPFANLSSFDGADPGAAPSVVGRGGLGAALGRAGVVALVVEGGAPPPPEEEGLERALVRSPRLLTRAAGGTLELAPGRESELRATGSKEKHGCSGCPTPCGWSFEVEGGPGSDRGGERGGDRGVDREASPGADRRPARVGGRFSALQGFEGRGDPVALLATCNDLGVDARLAARLMHEAAAVSASGFLEDLVTPGRPAHRAALAARGTEGLGASFSRGDLAAEVGQALAVRGPEPVRSLSVLGLSAAGLGDGQRAALLAPFEWTGDPEVDAGTLARWHECLAAAVDVTGFCAFSAAGLLADGLLGVEELGREIAPRPGGWRPSAGLLGAGAAHLALHEELAGGPPAAPPDLEARHPLAVAAYGRARTGSGAAARSRGPEPRRSQPSRFQPGRPEPAGAEPGEGVVRLVARGPLGARLLVHPGRVSGEGEEPVVLELRVPAGGLVPRDLVGALAEACPAAAPWLLDAGGRVLPAVVPLSGSPPAGAERLLAGDEVELVLAIPGG